MNTLETTQTRPIIPALGNVWSALKPLSPVIVRVATGLLMVPHGAQKLFGAFGGYGLEGTAGWLESIGFAPGLLFALAIGLLEFFGGLLLTVGLLTRPVAAAVLVFMTVAVLTHIPAGYFWINGGFETPLMWGLLALATLIQGGGKFSIDHKIGREF
ncbi:DoxX family protein [Thalassospira sp.]|uniref:DoxX family protein n=1 Tax=Thalassospira sp. TaxID=1912094 RepID=UPI000C4FF2A7|nr:DoxX family protein [Thalassospira sp.]MBC08362.1 DoxX family protein [Thalassospira sp.]|tara:strand:- start:3767 stop:4237 length:471 start_codon:yes stop_codon:yes gene_type:complete